MVDVETVLPSRIGMEFVPIISQKDVLSFQIVNLLELRCTSLRFWSMLVLDLSVQVSYSMGSLICICICAVKYSHFLLDDSCLCVEFLFYPLVL